MSPPHWRTSRQWHTTPHTRSKRSAHGFSIVEAVIAILMVGTVLVAVMTNVADSKMGQYTTLERSGAHLLAENLLAEIVSQPYEEPDDTPKFGRESGESGGRRDLWDDVDDYKSWSSSPPESKDGIAIAGASWTRTAEVKQINPNNLSLGTVVESGAKLITVTVTRGDRIIATRVAVRTNVR